MIEMKHIIVGGTQEAALLQRPYRAEGPRRVRPEPETEQKQGT